MKINNIQKRKLERILLFAAIGLFVIAWILGGIREESDLAPSLQQALPAADHIEYLSNNTYKALNSSDSLLAYITLKSATGYGGPLKTAVAVDTRGKVIGIAVVNSKETPSYLQKVMSSRMVNDLLQTSFKNQFILGKDINGVSGATFTSRALCLDVKQSARYTAEKYLQFELPENEKNIIQFGFTEIILILLFAVGYFAHKKSFPYTKAARWTTMLIGLGVLGFVYNRPVTLSKITMLALGYFPDFHTHVYWYLLLGGIFFVFTADNKNPYCQWFCPFGAAQECLGAIGGAKSYQTGQFSGFLKWLPRVLALTAILLALYFRNPGMSSYEIFGTLFNLTGSNLQFAVLGIILLMSLFIKRPWCKYLCPLKPVMDAYRILRNRIKELWLTINPKTHP